MRLSEHFELSDFERTATGLPNRTPGPLVLNLRDLCREVLEPLRVALVPVTINSAYRCAAVNRAVGSSPGSPHLHAEAADLEVTGRSNLEVATWIRDHLEFDQLILENYRPGILAGGWVHVSWTRRRALRRSVLAMTLRSHGPVYSEGLPGPNIEALAIAPE